ncbi:hypothetical protein AD41_5247 [Escherichia coli 3-020-07_S4_C3]|nr:hypothetical protein AD41_5247 [Escherichia coli 3-020-07_S4_C3]UQB85047.1 hypothetical protein [Salmonella enterica subsp. enterica serovar Typhimurium]
MPIRITNLQISKRVPGQDIWFTGSLIVTGSFKPSGLFPPALQK